MNERLNRRLSPEVRLATELLARDLPLFVAESRPATSTIPLSSWQRHGKALCETAAALEEATR